MGMVESHAGAMDTPVTLLKRSTTRTPSGGTKETWADHQELIASWSESHGGEGYESDQKVGTSLAKARVYYQDGVNSSDYRLRNDVTNVVYDILSIRMIGRRQKLELKLERKDNN